jgi:hypothetical protein
MTFVHNVQLEYVIFDTHFHIWSNQIGALVFFGVGSSFVWWTRAQFGRLELLVLLLITKI